MASSKLIAVVLLALGSAWMQAAQAPTSAPAGAAPKITFASTVYDFAKATSGEVVRHDFVFTNIGTATLEITDVRPGCGCTTAGAWDKRVEPGQTGRIPLQFNSAGFGGSVSKAATVACNDSNQPTVILQITGTVWKPIEITPTMASFSFSSEDQTNETKMLRIVNNAEEPITLSDVRSTNPSFKTDLRTVKPGKEFELLVTAVPPFTTPSVFGSISVRTSSAKSPVLNVSTYLSVQQQVVVIPEQLMLPPGPLTNVLNLIVSVRNHGSNPLAVSEAGANVPGVQVAVEELQPGRLFTLRASFPAGFEVKPGQKVELTARTDNPKFPRFQVPVYQPATPVANLAGSQPVPPTRALSTNVESVLRTVPTRAAARAIPSTVTPQLK